MISEIAESRADEFISIRHLGFITNGIEVTRGEPIRAWALAYENLRSYLRSKVPAWL